MAKRGYTPPAGFRHAAAGWLGGQSQAGGADLEMRGTEGAPETAEKKEALAQ